MHCAVSNLKNIPVCSIRWYTLDNNTVPPAYTLSPISSRLPDFISSDREKKKQAKQSWWDESDKMQYVLGVTATKVFDEERARKYIMSGIIEQLAN